jgi:hypothetical protein
MDGSDPAPTAARVLAAARAYAQQRFPDLHVEVDEFGTPSLGHDDAETHFVRVQAGSSHVLLRVTLSRDGNDRVEPLTAI